MGRIVSQIYPRNASPGFFAEIGEFFAKFTLPERPDEAAAEGIYGMER